MTPEELARLHAAAFPAGRGWSAETFADLCATPFTELTTCPGGFALWRAVAGEAELLTIAVDPALQRRGLGQRLMHTWMRAAASSADTAFLEVAADNKAACALYVRCGFERVSTRPRYYRTPDGPVDAWIMRATLAPDAPVPHP